jgi:signal transduction histidine kinase
MAERTLTRVRTWLNEPRVERAFNTFGMSVLFGFLLTQTRNSAEEAWWATFPFVGILIVAWLVEERPHTALVVAVAFELAACATGAAPTEAVGAVVVAAAALGRERQRRSVTVSVGATQPPGAARADRDPSREGLQATITLAMAAAVAAVAFIPWLLDWRTDAIFNGAPRDNDPWKTVILLMLAIIIRSNWNIASLLFRGASERVAEAEEAKAAAVAEERARIARELHDVVAHQMTVVVSQAQGGAAVVATDPGKARRAFDTISSTTRDALVELRRLVDVDRSGTSAPVSFDPTVPQPGVGLDDLARLAATAEAAGLEVAMDIEWATTRSVAVGLALSAYRTIQEALTNAAKHAPGSDVSVVLREEPAAVRVEVTNGPPKGRPTDMPGSGAGLVGMRERVAVFGGTLETGPTPDGGWSVVASFPTLEAPTTSE